MRLLIRSILFSYIAVYTTRQLLDGLSFGSNQLQTMLLVVLALALLNILMIPVFKLISLPSEGISYWFLSFIMNLIIIYVLTLFISMFTIKATVIPQFNIFGVVLPSKNLTIYWSAVVSAFLISMVYNSLTWLCKSK